ncbi:MAG: CAP domain-containing protein [Minisyncoccia bacterium]
MNNRTLLICIILVIVGYYNQNTLFSLTNKIKSEAGSILKSSQIKTESIPTPISIQDDTNKLPETSTKPKPKEEVNTPGPLQTFISETLNNNTVQEGAVTVETIIYNTNKQRNQQGKPNLHENQTLDRTAYVKAKDMLDRQYFEHISPSGKGVGELVTYVGYDYITVGENLALGNFANSTEIVDAWMNSPGHRANILNDNYTELGVGIVSGTYEGRSVWIAVQHFGRPLSDCPPTNTTLRNTITKNEKEATQMQLELDKQKSIINTPDAIIQPNYIQLVTTYNDLVKKYNELIKTTKDQIDEYNKQILKFNKCIGQVGTATTSITS